MKEIIRNIDIWNRYDLLERKANYSNFIDRNIKSQLLVLLDEIWELFKAVDDNNIEEVKKELLDVLFNTWQLLYSLEKKWFIDENFMKTSWKQQKDKIFKRSPFLKENRKVSIEEEEKLRYESKNKENFNS